MTVIKAWRMVFRDGDHDEDEGKFKYLEIVKSLAIEVFQVS